MDMMLSSRTSLLLAQSRSADPSRVRLSVTKWIHLNGGDASLLTFFHRVFNSLREGGKFILEPQEWDNYGRARRMDAVRLLHLPLCSI
jgi:hypothetical protein